MNPRFEESTVSEVDPAARLFLSVWRLVNMPQGLLFAVPGQVT